MTQDKRQFVLRAYDEQGKPRQSYWMMFYAWRNGKLKSPTYASTDNQRLVVRVAA